MHRLGPLRRRMGKIVGRSIQVLMRLARIPARILLRLFPRRAAWLRDIDVLWQPMHGRIWQEFFYRRTIDPYRFATDPYEIGKYRHTLEILGLNEGRSYARALEIGCAEGTFTAMLAPYCAELIAIDTSAVAVRRARQTLAAHAHVRVAHAWVPAQMPAGSFDLIVASDVLYYLPADVLGDFAGVLADALRPGGRLLALHYRGDFGQALAADRTHELLARGSGLPIGYEVVVDGVGPGGSGYRVTRFDRPVTDPGDTDETVAALATSS
jgi:SAM-dependent methyltransferase